MPVALQNTVHSYARDLRRDSRDIAFFLESSSYSVSNPCVESGSTLHKRLLSTGHRCPVYCRVLVFSHPSRHIGPRPLELAILLNPCRSGTSYKTTRAQVGSSNSRKMFLNWCEIKEYKTSITAHRHMT